MKGMEEKSSDGWGLLLGWKYSVAREPLIKSYCGLQVFMYHRLELLLT